MGKLITTSLSPAQVNALYSGAAVQLEIVKAPGANKFIKVNSVTIGLNAGSAAFTGGGVLTVEYTGGSVNALGASATFPVTTITNGGTLTDLVSTKFATTATTAVVLPTVNCGISISNATAAFAGGTGANVVVVVDIDTVTVA
tara:strand:+ start:6123 stop:6551 length:429 start_codon:yes stop_codon:yes gene_type:complete